MFSSLHNYKSLLNKQPNNTKAKLNYNATPLNYNATPTFCRVTVQYWLQDGKLNAFWDRRFDMHMRMDNDVSVEVMESPATWLAPLIPRPVRHGAAQST